MQSSTEFYELINSAPKRFVILTHQNPDADAVGSSLGWMLYLLKKGHFATVIVPNDVPKNLHWLPHYEKVLVFDKSAQTKLQAQQYVGQADVVCCLDFNDLHRIKGLGTIVEQTAVNKIKVLIDHHLFPADFANIVFSDTTKAATAQYVYEIIRELGDESLIDLPIAECLYAGIMTDTGSFRHNSTTAEVHLAVAALMQTGLNINKVHRAIFDNNSLGRMQLLGYVLSEKLKVLPHYRTAYMSISLEELKRFGSDIGDTEGIVNYGLEIENVVLSVLFIERHDEIKLSFRSVGDFSVRELANAYFSGGGHKNASGGRTNLSLQASLEKFLEVIPQYESLLLKVDK